MLCVSGRSTSEHKDGCYCVRRFDSFVAAPVMRIIMSFASADKEQITFTLGKLRHCPGKSLDSMKVIMMFLACAAPRVSGMSFIAAEGFAVTWLTSQEV